MAHGCAGLDPTWAHLPAPAPAHAHCFPSSAPTWLSPAAAFENEALTSALRASMSPAAHAAAAAAAARSACLSSPTTPSSPSTSSASELLSSGHDAPAPATGRARPAGPLRARAARPAAGAGPRAAAGRVAKRKPRPSRRAQTTYISADPANFRRMVQEVTGLPFAPAAAAEPAPAPSPAAALSWTAPPSYVLPTLDTSAFLLDRPATVTVPDEKASKPSTGGASAATDAAAAVTAAHQADDDSSAMLLELEAWVCAPAGASGFPTLESWGII